MASDRARSRNGYNKEFAKKYYSKNRDWILEKKKQYYKQPHVKEREKLYHHNYYLIHKEELKLKHREYLKNRKNNNK
jgi:hypothetical protein